MSCPPSLGRKERRKPKAGGGRRRAGNNVVSGKTLHTNVFIFGETFKNPA